MAGAAEWVRLARPVILVLRGLKQRKRAYTGAVICSAPYFGGSMSKNIIGLLEEIQAVAEKAEQELNQARTVDFKEIFKPF